MTLYKIVGKRLFDFFVSVIGLIICLPLFAIASVLIKLESEGPVFFKQERMGHKGRPFDIYKFRTMVINPDQGGGQISIGDDPRITGIGRFLRKYKIDEFPQLINILKGEMSFVGPRPELRCYVDMFRKEYEEILAVRPGITDLASIKYRDEAAVLEQAENPDAEYVNRILPEKIEMAKEYIKRSSFFFDLSLIFKTLPLLINNPD